MITVRLINNIVREIVPEHELSVAERYGEAFAAQCMEAPDEVKQGWVYDGETFSEPLPDDPEPVPTGYVTTEELDAAIDNVYSEIAAAITEGVNSIDE